MCNGSSTSNTRTNTPKAASVVVRVCNAVGKSAVCLRTDVFPSVSYGILPFAARTSVSSLRQMENRCLCGRALSVGTELTESSPTQSNGAAPLIVFIQLLLPTGC